MSDESVVSRGAMELMGTLLAGSMAETQSINDQLIENYKQEAREWAEAFAALYDRVDREEVLPRRLVAYLDGEGWRRSWASRFGEEV